MLDEFLPDGEGMTKVNDIVDRWNTENPNIHVTATKFDGAAQEMIKKVETDINAGAGPCLAQLGIEVPATLEEFQTAAATAAAKGEMTTPENISAFYGGQDVFAELATANANLSADFA